MSEVTNNKLVTGYSGCININVLGKVIEKKSTGSAIDSLTVGDVAYFTVELGVIEKGTSVDMGTIYSKQRNTADNFKCNGQKSAKTRGEVVTEEKTIDFTVDDDYNWAINNIEPAINKSVLASMIEGKMFLASPGSVTADGTKDKVVVVGFQGVSTNGTVTVDQDFQYFGLREGLLIDPNETETDGSAKLITNTEIPAFFDTPMISIEGIWTYAGATKKGFGSIYNFCTTHTFNEGTGADPNQLAFSLMRMADVQSKNLYTKDGINDPQEMQTSGDDTIYRLNCTHIIYVSGGGNPTVTGAEGDEIVVVDTEDNTIELYKHDGTDFVTTPVTSTFGQGGIAFAPKVDTALDGATSVTQNAYVVCKTAGTTGVGVAVDFGSKPVLEIYDWSFSDSKFEIFSS